MRVEINPVGGELKITTIEAMVESRKRIDCLASFKVEHGDVLYIEAGSDVSAEPLDDQLSFDF